MVPATTESYGYVHFLWVSQNADEHYQNSWFFHPARNSKPKVSVQHSGRRNDLDEKRRQQRVNLNPGKGVHRCADI